MSARSALDELRALREQEKELQKKLSQETFARIAVRDASGAAEKKRIVSSLPEEERGSSCYRRDTSIIEYGGWSRSHRFTFEATPAEGKLRYKTDRDAEFSRLQKLALLSEVLTQTEIDDFLRYFGELIIPVPCAPACGGGTLEVRAASFEDPLRMQMFQDLCERAVERKKSVDALALDEYHALVNGVVPECPERPYETFRGTFGKKFSGEKVVWWPRKWITYLMITLQKPDFVISVAHGCPSYSSCCGLLRGN